MPICLPFLAQVEYVKGWGKMKGADEIEVALLEGGSTTLKAANIIIATGSEVAPLPGIEIDEERCSVILTNIEFDRGVQAGHDIKGHMHDWRPH